MRPCRCVRKTSPLLPVGGPHHSVGAAGYGCDNATCESFFATLKREAFPKNRDFSRGWGHLRGPGIVFRPAFYGRGEAFPPAFPAGATGSIQRNPSTAFLRQAAQN